MCTHDSCSKSFWDSPPRRRLWKAGSSQNGDFLPRFGIYPFLAAFQGTSIPKRFGTTLFRPFWEVCVALFDPVSPPTVFPMCHIRMKNAIPRTFSSRSITSGSDEARLAGLTMRETTARAPLRCAGTHSMKPYPLFTAKWQIIQVKIAIFFEEMAKYRGENCHLAALEG